MTPLPPVPTSVPATARGRSGAGDAPQDGRFAGVLAAMDADATARTAGTATTAEAAGEAVPPADEPAVLVTPVAGLPGTIGGSAAVQLNAALSPPAPTGEGDAADLPADAVDLLADGGVPAAPEDLADPLAGEHDDLADTGAEATSPTPPLQTPAVDDAAGQPVPAAGDLMASDDAAVGGPTAADPPSPATADAAPRPQPTIAPPADAQTGAQTTGHLPDGDLPGRAASAGPAAQTAAAVGARADGATAPAAWHTIATTTTAAPAGVVQQPPPPVGGVPAEQAGTATQDTAAETPIAVTGAGGPAAAPSDPVGGARSAVLGSLTAAPALPTPAVQVASAVAALRRGAADGVHEMSLEMHPAELGRVHVEVEVRAGIINLRLAAEHDATRALLSSHMDDLRSSLQQGGLESGSMELSQHAFGDDGGAQPGGPSGSSAAVGTDATTSVTPGTVITAPRQHHTATSVDLLV